MWSVIMPSTVMLSVVAPKPTLHLDVLDWTKNDCRWQTHQLIQTTRKKFITLVPCEFPDCLAEQFLRSHLFWREKRSFSWDLASPEFKNFFFLSSMTKRPNNCARVFVPGKSLQLGVNFTLKNLFTSVIKECSLDNLSPSSLSNQVKCLYLMVVAYPSMVHLKSALFR